jgi:hypothetical protein
LATHAEISAAGNSAIAIPGAVTVLPSEAFHTCAASLALQIASTFSSERCDHPFKIQATVPSNSRSFFWSSSLRQFRELASLML